MEYLEKLDYSFFQYIEQRLATSSQKNLAYELKVSKSTMSSWNQAIKMKNLYLAGYLTQNDLLNPKIGGVPMQITPESKQDLMEEHTHLSYKEMGKRYHVHKDTIRHWIRKDSLPELDPMEKRKNQEGVKDLIHEILSCLEKEGMQAAKGKFHLNRNRIYLILMLSRAIGFGTAN